MTDQPLALDLVNTRPVGADRLATPDALRTWLLRQAERFPSAREFAEVELTDADLDSVRRVRAHTARLVEHARHGTRPSTNDLAALNRAVRAAPAVTELTLRGDRVAAVRRRAGPRGVRLAAWLAEAAVELLSDPAVTEVRQCAADDCVLLFLPAHPRRRWCSSARCGNRARVARHYRRHAAPASDAG